MTTSNLIVQTAITLTCICPKVVIATRWVNIQGGYKFFKIVPRSIFIRNVAFMKIQLVVKNVHILQELMSSLIWTWTNCFQIVWLVIIYCNFYTWLTLSCLIAYLFQLHAQLNTLFKLLWNSHFILMTWIKEIHKLR